MKQPLVLVLAALASGAAGMAIVWGLSGDGIPPLPPTTARQPVTEAPVRVAPAPPPADRASPSGVTPPVASRPPAPPPRELLEALRRAQAEAPQRSAASAPAQPTLSFEEAIAIARARQGQTQTVVTNPFAPPRKP